MRTNTLQFCNNAMKITNNLNHVGNTNYISIYFKVINLVHTNTACIEQKIRRDAILDDGNFKYDIG